MMAKLKAVKHGSMGVKGDQMSGASMRLVLALLLALCLPTHRLPTRQGWSFRRCLFQMELQIGRVYLPSEWEMASMGPFHPIHNLRGGTPRLQSEGDAHAGIPKTR